MGPCNQSQHSMRLCESGIKCKGLVGCGAGLLNGGFGRNVIGDDHQYVAVRQTFIGRRIIRIGVDRCVEIAQSSLESLFSSPVQAVTPPEIGVVCLCSCRLTAQRMCACLDSPTRLDFPGHSGGHIVLQGENVLRITVVFLRPEVTLVRHLNELCGDAQMVPFAPHAALYNILNPEFKSDLVEPLVAMLISHDRSSRDYSQLFGL